MKMRQSSRSRKLSKEMPSPILEEPIGEVKTFELTVCQANAILKLLPKKYSLGVFEEEPKREQKPVNYSKGVQDLYERRNYDYSYISNTSKFLSERKSSLVGKKCTRIIHQLVRGPNNYLFKRPEQNPDQQQIYLETIAFKARKLHYRSVNQFFKEVELLIRNVSDNAQDTKTREMVGQFESFYEQLKSETQIDRSPQKINKPISKSNQVSSKKVKAKKQYRRRVPVFRPSRRGQRSNRTQKHHFTRSQRDMINEAKESTPSNLQFRRRPNHD